MFQSFQSYAKTEQENVLVCSFDKETLQSFSLEHRLFYILKILPFIICLRLVTDSVAFLT